LPKLRSNKLRDVIVYFRRFSKKLSLMLTVRFRKITILNLIAVCGLCEFNVIKIDEISQIVPNHNLKFVRIIRFVYYQCENKVIILTSKSSNKV
jgi:hypothetical protein